jgi:hypothetical protein
MLDFYSLLPYVRLLLEFARKSMIIGGKRLISSKSGPKKIDYFV